jgi:hypothetical protein
MTLHAPLHEQRTDFGLKKRVVFRRVPYRGGHGAGEPDTEGYWDLDHAAITTPEPPGIFMA